MCSCTIRHFVHIVLVNREKEEARTSLFPVLQEEQADQSSNSEAEDAVAGLGCSACEGLDAFVGVAAAAVVATPCGPVDVGVAGTSGLGATLGGGGWCGGGAPGEPG